jgi:hypothetical protein
MCWSVGAIGFVGIVVLIGLTRRRQRKWNETTGFVSVASCDNDVHYGDEDGSATNATNFEADITSNWRDSRQTTAAPDAWVAEVWESTLLANWASNMDKYPVADNTNVFPKIDRFMLSVSESETHSTPQRPTNAHCDVRFPSMTTDVTELDCIPCHNTNTEKNIFGTDQPQFLVGEIDIDVVCDSDSSAI